MSRWTKRVLLVCLVIVVPAYGWLMWQGPWIFDGDHLRKTDLQPADGVVITGFRTSLVALGAGVVAGAGLFYTHRSVQHTRDMLEHTRAKDREQADLTREAQVTDQYVEAIKLLSSDHLTQRLGGLYSLERIMHDSSKDERTIVEVLSAFVRTNTFHDPERDPFQDQDDSYSDGRRSSLWYPTEDVQAALTVLCRASSRTAADLRGANLRGTSLRQADLTGANLEDADLREADLREADLEGANLREAWLGRTNLVEANLRKAVLVKANARGADLHGADLREADLEGADLQLASLGDARMASAFLHGADLRDIDGEVDLLVLARINSSTKLPPRMATDARIVARIEEGDALQ